MRFYTQQQQYYCGIDLHARKMYVCIFNNLGKIVLHKNIKTNPEKFFESYFHTLRTLSLVSSACFHGIGSRICAMSTASHLYWDMRFI